MHDLVGREGAPKEEAGGNRNGQHQQSQACRYDNGIGDPQGKAEALGQADKGAPLSLGGQARQCRAGQGGHKNPLGKLEQPAGIPQRGDAAGTEQRRQHSIHHQTELIDCRSEYDRNQQTADPYHSRMTWPPLGANQQPQTAQGRDLPGDLQHAAEHDAVGKAEDRFGQEARDSQGAANDGHIQQHRSKGRGAEMPPGVAHPGRQGEQPDPEQIGKGEFGQGNRQDQRVRVKARRKKTHQGGGAHNPESGQQKQDPARDPEHGA